MLPLNLPATSTLSPEVISFLNTTFHPNHDLTAVTSESTHLVTELDSECTHLAQQLADLTRRLEALLLSYASSSDQIGGAFHRVRHRLEDLSSEPSSSDDGGGELMAAEELPALAKEVARVAMVRVYAETALKLDSLVGEIEDSVSSLMNINLKKHSIAQSTEELQNHAITSLKLTEDVLASVMKAHPQWVRLISAADHRVDRTLAILRPQAIAAHRALLASLGWPPPLSKLSSSNLDAGKGSELPNPLSAMHGELKQNYSENFLALCGLQELQRRRKLRQLGKHIGDIVRYQPLWGIEELVNPLSLASYNHFQRWVDKPEFIFALVYKVTRDYIDSVDELLQPLVDKAMLTGYSCREEWISSMVTSLSTYLAKEIFPAYISRLNEAADAKLQTRMSWLHLVDLMISFDKRILKLAAHSGVIDSFEYSLLQRMSSLSVFCDRPDWLDLWAEIELGSIFEKLLPETEDDRNWMVRTQAAVAPGSDNYKSPSVSYILLEQIELVIDRCKSLPSVFLRSRFVRLVGAPIIQTLLKCLLTKCIEAEGLTALADDNALTRVMTSVNSARHLGSVLKLRCDDDLFLEMALQNDDESGGPVNESSLFADVSEGVENGAFEEEIGRLEEFRSEWADKLKNAVLRGFDVQIRDYIRNKKQWLEKDEEGWTVTQSFVLALDYMQRKISKLEEGLNNEDFIIVWKGIASGVDRLIFNGVLTSNTKFYGGGVARFAGDMDVLFDVFKSWCLRPEGFFPRLSEGLRLLKMEEHELQALSIKGEAWMNHNKFRHLSIAEAEKIARCRGFTH